MAEYTFPQTVKMVIDHLRIRTPRLFPSFIQEVGDEASRLVTAGAVTIDDEGNPLFEPGLTIPEWIDQYVAKRPHGVIPAAVADAGAACWESGNLTLQGERWREFKAALGSDKAADQAMLEEARLYQTTPGSTRKGIAPISDDDGKKKPKANHADNPWHRSNWNLTKQGALVRNLGDEKAAAIARAVGSKIGATKPNPNF